MCIRDSCRLETVVHPCASSVPEAPPNEMITSPPAARMPWTSESIVVPLGSVSFATVAPTPPQVGVQPPLPTTNPRVKTLIPDCCCLLYTSDAADERSSVDLGGRRI